MKLLLVLLILTSCGDTDKPKGDYFTPANTGIFCKKITHDYTLKECWNRPATYEIYNAVNIIKVTR